MYPIAFPELDLDTALEIAEMKCEEKGADPSPVLRKISSENGNNFKSGRAIEKLVIEQYIEQFGKELNGRK